MTEPIRGVRSSLGATGGSSHSGGGLAGDHKKRGPMVPHDDLVEISKDARERSAGKVKKGILEYLKELFG